MAVVWYRHLKVEIEDLQKDHREQLNTEFDDTLLLQLITLDLFRAGIPFILGNCDLDFVDNKWANPEYLAMQSYIDRVRRLLRIHSVRQLKVVKK